MISYSVQSMEKHTAGRQEIIEGNRRRDYTFSNGVVVRNVTPMQWRAIDNLPTAEGEFILSPAFGKKMYPDEFSPQQAQKKAVAVVGNPEFKRDLADQGFYIGIHPHQQLYGYSFHVFEGRVVPVRTWDVEIIEGKIITATTQKEKDIIEVLKQTYVGSPVRKNQLMQDIYAGKEFSQWTEIQIEDAFDKIMKDIREKLGVLDLGIHVWADREHIIDEGFVYSLMDTKDIQSIIPEQQPYHIKLPYQRLRILRDMAKSHLGTIIHHRPQHHFRKWS